MKAGICGGLLSNLTENYKGMRITGGRGGLTPLSHPTHFVISETVLTPDHLPVPKKQLG